MKFENLNKWTSAITKIGAVGSILFFALELHQNSQQLEAQSRYAQFEIQSYDTNRVVYENADLASILLKERNQKSLSELESFILRRYNVQMIRNWEFEFMERQRGILDSNLNVDRWANNLNNNPERLEAWTSLSPIWQDSFKFALNDALTNAAVN
jgi:hypothetical protein|tara:strand:+ start:226 stop:690 length:465 start_codon:yes stop_codon:yes gene_type:complete